MKENIELFIVVLIAIVALAGIVYALKQWFKSSDKPYPAPVNPDGKPGTPSAGDDDNIIGPSDPTVIDKPDYPIEEEIVDETDQIQK